MLPEDYCCTAFQGFDNVVLFSEGFKITIWSY